MLYIPFFFPVNCSFVPFSCDLFGLLSDKNARHFSLSIHQLFTQSIFTSILFRNDSYFGRLSSNFSQCCFFVCWFYLYDSSVKRDG